MSFTISFQIYTVLYWIVEKVNTSKSPLRKVLDVQDADKSSDPVASGLHIEYQVDGKDNKVLDSKTVQFVIITVILAWE